MAGSHPMADEAARRALKDDLARFHCRVQQPDDPPLFSRMPESAMQTVHWKWTDLEPLLERIGNQLALEPGGTRRTLRLHNPGLPYGTTHTFWGSIQVILPGEIATNHRHTANAFRFVMKGGGATTTVDGERYAMHEGDLALTPGMAWHDHEYRGDTPMIWLDVLDISLMKSMHATFFEPSRVAQQPVAEVPDASWRRYGSGLMSPPGAPPAGGKNPLLVYPRAMAEAALAQAQALPPDPYEGVVLEYRNPATGGPAMTTLGMRLHKLTPGLHTRARRHTGSKLYYAIRGRGTTVVDGRAYEWGPGDFLAIKPWAWHEHLNPFGEDALLFQVNDTPALAALGYYVEEALAGNGGHQPLLP